MSQTNKKKIRLGCPSGYTGFGETRMMPVFENDQRQADQPADGYEIISTFYNGRNRAEIIPIRLVATGFIIGQAVEIGQSYTIDCFDSRYGPIT